MVDSALDRVFDEPFDIRSDTDFERILLEPAGAGRPAAAASALAGFVAMATPIAQRTLRLVRAGSKAPIPAAKAAKYAAIAVPIGVQLSSTVRRGIRELQALASFIIWRLRDEGIEPERSFVARADRLALRRRRPAAEPRHAPRSHRRIADTRVDPPRHRHRLRGARVQARPVVDRRVGPPRPCRAGAGRPGKCGPSRARTTCELRRPCRRRPRSSRRPPCGSRPRRWRADRRRSRAPA